MFCYSIFDIGTSLFQFLLINLSGIAPLLSEIQQIQQIGPKFQ